VKRVKLKKRHIEEVDTEGSWAISYGDMVTLLLSFFVIFFSFDFQKERSEQLDYSALKNFELVNSSNDSGGKSITSLKTESIEGFSEVQTIVEKIEEGKLIIFFKGLSFFESGSVAVSETGKIMLEKFAQKYLPFAGKYSLKIHAFTDSRPVSPSNQRYKDNIELSALRSIAVLKTLKQSGVPSRKLEITGKGILSSKSLELLGIKETDENKINEMSRTVAFVMYREDAS